MKKFTPPINQILFFTLKSCIIPLIITNGLKKNYKQLINTFTQLPQEMKTHPQKDSVN